MWKAPPLLLPSSTFTRFSPRAIPGFSPLNKGGSPEARRSVCERLEGQGCRLRHSERSRLSVDRHGLAVVSQGGLCSRLIALQEH